MKMKNLFLVPALIAGLGMILSTTSRAQAATHYVDVNSTNATPPYTNWATAATNIQDAVDAAVTGDEIVVTNGIYPIPAISCGFGCSYSLLNVYKPVSLQSVSGPQFTTILGSTT